MVSERETAAKNIAGEITLADGTGAALRKWREIFGIKQTELAKRLEVSPSVISDYESLIVMDEERGGQVIGKFIVTPAPEAILAMSEFEAPMKASRLVKLIDGEVIAHKRLLAQRELRGFTVIDSIQAILNLTDRDFRSIYGSSSERALIFTKVKLGRSPMIAVKVTQPKPGIIVLHGLAPNRVDKLARYIAEKENIPLVVSRLKTEAELLESLRRGLT
jgi:putative transcriptional regulator